jgi:two-component system LytT family response regulator
MFNVLLVEDNNIQLSALKQLLRNKYKNFQITTASDYEAAMISMELNEFNLFILDIQLDSETSGIDLAQKIRSDSKYLHTPIIFITALPDKVFTAINDIHCYGYIKKPYNDDDVIQAIDSLFNTPVFQNVSFQFNDINGIFFRITLSDIICIKISSHNYYFYTLKGNYNVSSYTLKKSHSDILSHLTRCHKCYYINLEQVVNYDRTTQLLSMNGHMTPIPVGRSYKNIFIPEEKDD